eukprot:g8037.t1
MFDAVQSDATAGPALSAQGGGLAAQASSSRDEKTRRTFAKAVLRRSEERILGKLANPERDLGANCDFALLGSAIVDDAVYRHLGVPRLDLLRKALVVAYDEKRSPKDKKSVVGGAISSCAGGKEVQVEGADENEITPTAPAGGSSPSSSTRLALAEACAATTPTTSGRRLELPLPPAESSSAQEQQSCSTTHTNTKNGGVPAASATSSKQLASRSPAMQAAAEQILAINDHIEKEASLDDPDSLHVKAANKELFHFIYSVLKKEGEEIERDYNYRLETHGQVSRAARARHARRSRNQGLAQHDSSGLGDEQQEQEPASDAHLELDVLSVDLIAKIQHLLWNHLRPWDLNGKCLERLQQHADEWPEEAAPALYQSENQEEEAQARKVQSVEAALEYTNSTFERYKYAVSNDRGFWAANVLKKNLNWLEHLEAEKMRGYGGY